MTQIDTKYENQYTIIIPFIDRIRKELNDPLLILDNRW